MTRKANLLAACPRGDQVANIPKALENFVEVLDTEMTTHSSTITSNVDNKNQQLREQVEQMTRNLRYDQIMSDAQARAYGLAWMAG